MIGHQPKRGVLMADAGYMALSNDMSTANHAIDWGFGLVAEMTGTPYPELIVRATSQEHGQTGLREGSTAMLPDLAIADRIRILPVHACATVAMHPHFAVLAPDGRTIVADWPIMRGW